MLVIIAMTDVSAWSKYCTLYTQEVFALLIAGIFLYEACKWIIKVFLRTNRATLHEYQLSALSIC